MRSIFLICELLDAGWGVAGLPDCSPVAAKALLEFVCTCFSYKSIGFRFMLRSYLRTKSVFKPQSALT